MSPYSAQGWNLELDVEGDVDIAPISLDEVQDHVALALVMRPELNEAKLLLERDRLQVVRTRDGLLPRLDFFLGLGKSGFADSFGESWRDLDGQAYDLQAGLAFTYPVGNRAAQALHDRARLSRQQAAESVENLTRLVDFDVRSAHVDVEVTREQIEATRATRELRQEALRTENERFRVGASTSFLVAQAQRDLLQSQINEVRAKVNYRQALIELYRLDGTLLQRRAILAPGR
jgi:outer membrane protein TolC